MGSHITLAVFAKQVGDCDLYSYEAISAVTTQLKSAGLAFVEKKKIETVHVTKRPKRNFARIKIGNHIITSVAAKFWTARPPPPPTYVRVVSSILFYAAPKTSNIIQCHKLIAVYKSTMLRVCSAFRIVSDEVPFVLIRIMSIDILADGIYVKSISTLSKTRDAGRKRSINR